MKNAKRILAALLACVMALSILTACSSGGTAAGKYVWTGAVGSINTARKNHGVKALASDDNLNAAAEILAQYYLEVLKDSEDAQANYNAVFRELTKNSLDDEGKLWINKKAMYTVKGLREDWSNASGLWEDEEIVNSTYIGYGTYKDSDGNACTIVIFA